MENNSVITSNQIPNPIPIIEQTQSSNPNHVSYMELLHKMRHTEETENPEQKDENKQSSKPIKTRGFKRTTNSGEKKYKFNKKQHSNNVGVQKLPRLPRLTKEEFQLELEKCQKVFMNELKKYLFEEVKTREITEVKDNNQTNNKDNENNENNKNTKTKSKKQKMNNLERIQSGSSSVNIVRIIGSRIETSKQMWIKKMIRIKQNDLMTSLSEYMEKYNVSVSYKTPNVILLHSPYLMV
jgi:hypothetical protein